MVKRCYILLSVFVFSICMCVHALSVGEYSSQEQDPMIQSILTGERHGDSSIDTVQKGSIESSGCGKEEITFKSAEGTKEDPSRGWEALEMEYNGRKISSVEYKCKIVGDGSGPTIIYITGDGNHHTHQPKKEENPNFWLPDKADWFIDRPEFEGYNIFVFSSNTPELVALAPESAKNDAEELKKYNRFMSMPGGNGRDFRAIYSSKVVELIQSRVSSQDFSLVGHSLGGNGLDSTHKALKINGLNTYSATFVDGIYWKGFSPDETHNKYLTESLIKDNVTLVIAHLGNEGKAKDSCSYLSILKKAGYSNVVDLDLHGEQNLIQNATVQHGQLIYCQKLIDAISENLPPLYSNKVDSSSNDVSLTNNQALLKEKLSGTVKKTISIANSAKNVVSSATKTISSMLSDTLKAATKASTTSKTSVSSTSGSTAKTSGTSLSSASNTFISSKNSGSVWAKITTGISANIKNLTKVASLL